MRCAPELDPIVAARLHIINARIGFLSESSLPFHPPKAKGNIKGLLIKGSTHEGLR